MSAVELSRTQVRRLREVYRSAGWPCLDEVEVDLLAAGLLERVRRDDDEPSVHGLVRVTERGLQALAVGLGRNRAAFDAHEALVARVARELQRGGRLAYTGLSLRAALPVPAAADEARPAPQGVAVEDAVPTAPPRRWVVAKPDVFSIRNSSVAGYLAPAVHEIKVRRADLLGELRAAPRPQAKRAAYLAMSSECWYVLGLDARGRAIGDPSEVPAECGVLMQQPTATGEVRLQLARSAPQRPMDAAAGLPFAVWLALAKATPLARETDAQAPL